jgi:UDPglucose--hexose-1-phosphate uridylyltransferase
MAKYIPDIKTQRWVIVARSRTKRPTNAPEKKANEFICPFCEGNEYLTPPEVYRIGSGGKDEPGWQVRVVPNKFPITDIHEVIIHSPDDKTPMEDLPKDQVVRILTAYRDRYLAHENDGQVLIFNNQGFAAGASLGHPHTQLVVVPRQINLDALSLEPIANIVSENKTFVTYCPDFSQWPYEVWIAPKEKGLKFSDTHDTDLPVFAETLVTALKKVAAVLADPIQPMRKVSDPFVYNYYIYHGVNWFLRIIPRAISRAGFELGTGLNVNIVDPTDASERLKEIDVNI